MGAVAGSLVWLSSRARVGEVSSLVGRFGTLAGAEGWCSAELGELGLHPSTVAGMASTSSLEWGGEVIYAGEERYPSGLLELQSVPPVLWCEGDLGLLEEVGVAVVGSRRCTEYGKRTARGLAAAIAGMNGVVVSGGARGIDEVAHAGAGSRTIVVLASGLGDPGARRWLRRVREHGGLVISESPPETPPSRWSFPRRNRLVAALGRATVVIEAGVRSGSLITARRALDLGRDLLAVPGRIDAPASIGTNRLIAEGAQPLLQYGQVAEYFAAGSHPVPRLLRALHCPATIEQASARSGLSRAALFTWIGTLEAVGVVERVDSGLRYRVATTP